MDTNRFTQKSLEALQAAQQLAQSYGNAQVEQVHLLYALLSQENGLIGQLMSKLGLNTQQVQTACESAVNRLPKISGSNQQPYVTASLSQALTEAENQMKQMRDEYISVEHLFLGLLEKGQHGSPSVRIPEYHQAEILGSLAGCSRECPCDQ